MTDTNHFYILFLAAEKFANSFGLCLYGASRCFLYKDVTVLTMLESKQYKVNGFFQTHDKASHLRLGKGDGVALAYLLYPQWDNATTRTHHIAVACTADLGFATVAALGHCHLFFYSLGDTHGVDRISRLVGRKTYNAFHTGFHGSGKHIVGSNHVGANSLHREKLTRRHLLQSSGMEDIIHTRHCTAAAFQTAYIAYIEFNFMSHLRIFGLILVTHIVLLLLVATEYADFFNICCKETVKYSISKTTGTSGNHQCFIFKY